MQRFVAILTALACLVLPYQVPCEHCLEQTLHCQVLSVAVEHVEGSHRDSHSESSHGDHHHDGCCSAPPAFVVSGKTALEPAGQFVYAAGQCTASVLALVRLGEFAIETSPPPPPLRLHLLKRVLLV